MNRPAVPIFLALLALAGLLTACQPKPAPHLPGNTKQFALLVNLKKDSAAVAQYEAYHRHVWPEVEQKFRDAGILDFKIYRFGYQTFLLITTRADFDPAHGFNKISGPAVAEWDRRMSAFQALTGQETWQPATVIYNLN